jgi:hypothetical protein
MKKNLIIILKLLVSAYTFGQGFEPARKINYIKQPNSLVNVDKGLNRIFNSKSKKAETDKMLGTGSEFFQQLALNVSNTVPRITIKAVKLYAKVGKTTYLDFYILSSIPTLSTNPIDSARNLGNELQNIYGGLLNPYFSKTWYFNEEMDYQTRGLQVDLKGGYKLTESTKNLGTKNIYLHSGQLATEVRFLVPLFGSPTDNNLAGLTQIKVYGQVLYNNNKDYFSFFKDNNQNIPSNFLFSSTIEASLHIYNQIYISGGYSFSSISTIDNFGYFKMTYSK